MEVPLLSLIGFALAASITPGPNNLLVAANAAANGVRATWAHMLGIAVGFSAMIMLVGLGLAGVLAAHPGVAQTMRWASIAWLVWLAWKIATVPMGDEAAGDAAQPGMRFGFVTAVLFQWVNPKAWLLALSIAASWVRPEASAGRQLAVIGLVFLLVGPPCNLPWALLGAGAARVLRGGRRMRAFNVAMAILLVASMLPMVLEG